MNKDFISNIIKKALEKCEGLKFGSVSITLHFHESRVTKIDYLETNKEVQNESI